MWSFKCKSNQETDRVLTKSAFFCLCYSALCYTVLHMCGHTILHNYSVIIFCDGETSEIFLTTRALIYADLMGDYCDSWKVFTWRSGAQCDWTTSWLIMFVNTVDSFFSGLISNGDFANFWKYFTGNMGPDYSPPLFFDQLLNPISNKVGKDRLCPRHKFGLTKNFDIPAHLFLDFWNDCNNERKTGLLACNVHISDNL